MRLAAILWAVIGLFALREGVVVAMPFGILARRARVETAASGGGAGRLAGREREHYNLAAWGSLQPIVAHRRAQLRWAGSGLAGRMRGLEPAGWKPFPALATAVRVGTPGLRASGAVRSRKSDRPDLGRAA